MTSSAPSSDSLLQRLMPLGLAMAWLAAAAAGFGWMWRYAATAGATEEPPPAWPEQSTIVRSAGKPALVLFAHPRCPCTEATLGELAVLMQAAGKRVSAHVMFYHPLEEQPAWAHTALWEAAAAIPGVVVHEDAGGAEAALFHATVSGQTLLYDAEGNCQFTGGITAARGHAGDNAGRAAISALLRHEAPPGLATPVFGCALRGRTTASGRTAEPAAAITATLP